MASKIKLLVVDDELRFLATLSQRLSLRDFDVATASSGHEALRLARERSFDLALLDLKMPGMSGEEVLSVLRQQHPLMEVIILTGHGSIDSAVSCTRNGCYGYLQKPCETDELMEVLERAYQRRVQRKLQLTEERMAELVRAATGESPLSILRRLRELEESRER